MMVFAQQSENNYDKYLSQLDVPNGKNLSKGMQGVFGMGDTGGAAYGRGKQNLLPGINI